MEIGDLVPVGGSIKRYPGKATYHRLDTRSLQETRCPMSRVQFIPTLLLPKIRLSMNLLKTFRDAYVDAMLCFAQHVVHFNGGEVSFFKNIQDDDVRYLTASDEELF